MNVRHIVCALALLLLTGCYHARVTTGLTPSTEVIDIPFASAWIYGLVPPSIVDVENECENGVARVETQLSFVNQLVGAITFGIYTPMHIRVTCAAR
ncbi:Bor family protein [Rhodocaloribacter litoris]|uniref:Bor family protein n=1 Tax=Rhodocaloribacter litoris TaxID=2558931 RepID=UPI001423E731|nr:Bor family protein [Rhodocaloribacter litoris]QXD16354.1 Bor family protein [Rhodocaloribacter litoris]